MIEAKTAARFKNPAHTAGTGHFLFIVQEYVIPTHYNFYISLWLALYKKRQGEGFAKVPRRREIAHSAMKVACTLLQKFRLYPTSRVKELEKQLLY